MDFLPHHLQLEPVSRWPLRLAESEEKAILEAPIPESRAVRVAADKEVTLASVIHGNEVVTKLFLTTLALTARSSPAEVVLVDNRSDVRTRRVVNRFVERNPGWRLIANSDNRGFAAGVNQALGKVETPLVGILNSDLVLPPLWIETLAAHLGQRDIGLVGPCTNRCGNQAEIPAEYRDWAGLAAFAGDRRRSYCGKSRNLSMAVLFCAFLPTRVWRDVGPLDERFGIGLFEDDDYSLRLKRRGYRIVCAQDGYVHHYGHASFAQSGSAEAYQRLLAHNRRLFEDKWKRTWRPPKKSLDPLYLADRDRLRDGALDTLPQGAKTAVVSRGDPGFLATEEWTHFPRGADGRHAGHHPRDGADALEQVIAVRGEGFGFLVIPQSEMWWLESYPELANHLHDRVMWADERLGRIFRL